MSLAFFKCAVCHNEEEIEIVKGRINEPGVCSRCQTTKVKASVYLIHLLFFFKVDAIDSQQMQVHRQADH